MLRMIIEDEINFSLTVENISENRSTKENKSQCFPNPELIKNDS